MNIKQRVLGLLAIMVGIVMFQASAWAKGTASTTVISNVARVTFLTNGTTGDTATTAGTADTTVPRIGGDTIADPGNQTMGPNDTKTFSYTFYNTGNATDTFDISVDAFTLSGGAAAWNWGLSVGSAPGDMTSTLNDTKVSAAVAADGSLTCTVTVWANNLIANSPDGSRAEFKLVIASGLSRLSDSYTGDNNTIYSYGGGVNNDTSWATVGAANITLAKTITTVTTGGVASMPKPGATILYTLTYNNISSATAGESVVVRDSIPLNCVWDSASRQNGSLGASATFVDNDSGATGWQLQVTTNTNPNTAYYHADWVEMPYFGGAASTVKWIRWRKMSVAAGNTATLRFRVIIQ